MIWILGGALGLSIALNRFLWLESKRDEKTISDLTRNYRDKKDECLDLQNLIKDYMKQINGKDKKIIDLKAQLLTEEQSTDKVVDTLEQKLIETREQLKLEDEASCKIIKELEDEVERERALNQTYSGYVKYIINAPRAVRRRFINGECVDWYDENGVLRMKIKEEK